MTSDIVESSSLDEPFQARAVPASIGANCRSAAGSLTKVRGKLPFQHETVRRLPRTVALPADALAERRSRAEGPSDRRRRAGACRQGDHTRGPLCAEARGGPDERACGV